ncbi:MAG: SLC13 family permease [Magnetococcales bacterium]|nr:SLC13 family permease [Magnetococcales bacterium]
MMAKRVFAFTPHLFALLLSLLSLLIFFMEYAWPKPGMGLVAALVVFTIGCWATGAYPAHLTAILFFCLAMIFKVAPPATVFSGFHSPAFWLVFSGLVIGTAIVKTGLGDRLAALLAYRLTGSYAGLISGVTLAGMVMGFVIPTSMGRMAFLIPVVLLLTRHFGFKPGSNGYYGLVLAAAFGSHVTNFAVLTANVVNVILAGFGEALYGTTFFFGPFLLLHYPVLGLAKAVAIILLVLWLFPDLPSRGGPHEKSVQKRLSAAEIGLAIGLSCALLLWMTDRFHHISPAWVGLLVGVYLLFPGVGPLSKAEDFALLDLKPLFFVAGVIGVGALVADSGLGTLLSERLRELLPLRAGADFQNFMTLASTAILTSLVTTLPGAPAVLTPFAKEMADLTGFSIEAVLMSQMVGFAMAPFPYQAPPLMAALALGQVPLLVAIRFSLILAAIHFFLLMPLDYLWWKGLGWI